MKPPSVSAMSRRLQNAAHDHAGIDVLATGDSLDCPLVDLLDVLRHRADMALALRVALVAVLVDRQFFRLAFRVGGEYGGERNDVLLLANVRHHHPHAATQQPTGEAKDTAHL